MYDFHKDRKRYFEIQKEVTQQYIIPFLSDYFDITKPQKVLEIGSAEAGVLKPFVDKGHQCVGIEQSEQRVELATSFMQKELQENKIQFITKNVYEIDPDKENLKFNLVILKDVIEHLPEQEKFLFFLKKFLEPEGIVFIAFPPWQMPFGGHQQIVPNKIISKTPYVHLLPKPLYKFILKSFKLSPHKIQELLEIKETGISIERFEKIAQKAGFEILKKKFYLFNPIYKWKFGLAPKEQFKWIAAIPYIRNFFTTGVYYLLRVSNKTL